MSKTIIRKCNGSNCKSDYQDRVYGHGHRVHNTGKKGTLQTVKCTVCGNKP